MKVNMNINNIFAFWESQSAMPAYLELCKDTWKEYIPNCEIHIINYSNIQEYIGDVYDINKLKTISFAMQSDIISAAVLNKYGGLFLDIDCIATDDIFKIFNSISKDRLIAFGRPGEYAIHLAVLYCAKPNNPILGEWVVEAKHRLNAKPEKLRWDYFGNAIVNPLLKRYPEYQYIIDRTVSGNILESVVIMESNPANAILDYKNFWFNKYLDISLEVLNLVNCGVISLHNSWTPGQYKLIIDKQEFLNTQIPIARFLKALISGIKRVEHAINYPVIEGFLTLELEKKNIRVSRRYFKNMLVIDVNINNHKFAFDITIDCVKERISADLVFRNIDLKNIKDQKFFNKLNFIENKANIGEFSDKEDLLQFILNCCQFFSVFSDIHVSNVSNQTNNLIIDGVYINLHKLEIKESKLFISGVAFILGINVVDWGDIDYKLIFERNGKEIFRQLAKIHKSEITSTYGQNGVCYDKCYFTTYNEQGLELSDIPIGKYDIYLLITSTKTKLTKKQKIRTDLVFLNTEHFEFLKTDYFLFLNKLAINDFIPIIAHNKEKKSITGSFKDSAGNVLYSGGQTVNCFTRFNGKNNIVEIDSRANIRNLYIECMGNDSYIKIGKNVSFHGVIRLGYDCQVTIGDGVTSTNPVYVTCAEKTKIIIGDDCMFATNNQIRTDDAHPIYDVYTGKRLNMSKDIVLGGHVWVGYGATLLGGAELGAGSVVGAFSLVRKKFPNNCIVGGVPAKLLKKDVFWERPLLLNEQYEVSFSDTELAQKSYCQPTLVINDNEIAPRNLNVFVHAHPDDIELFMGIAAQKAIKNGDHVIFLLMTAGDGGKKHDLLKTINGVDISYHDGRLKAHNAAIKYWLNFNETERFYKENIHEYHIDCTAFSEKLLSYNMMLPDGWRGIGFHANRYETLERLYLKNIQGIHDLNGQFYKSFSDIESTILSLLLPHIERSENIIFHIPEFNYKLNQGSHSDHYMTGELMRNVISSIEIDKSIEILLYSDYENGDKPINLSSEKHKDHEMVNSLMDDILIENGRNEQVREVHASFIGKEYISRVFNKDTLNLLSKESIKMQDTWPVLEKYFVSNFRDYNIDCVAYYYKYKLVLDFEKNKLKFAFDITHLSQDNFDLELVLRNFNSSELVNISMLNSLTFEGNKTKLISGKNKEVILAKMLDIYNIFN